MRPLAGQQYQIIEGRLVSIADTPQNYIDKGYSINDIIYSIVTTIMDKVRLAPWGLYKIKDEQAMKAYQAMQTKTLLFADDAKKIRDLRHKAIEPVKDPGKIGELLNYPNNDESFSDLVANNTGYDLLIGNSYIETELLEMGANKGMPQRFRNLPAQFITIKALDTDPVIVTSYVLDMWRNREYSAERIMHRKRWNPNYSINAEQLYGVAPMKAALLVINRDNSSLKSSAAAFQNSGISGILHMKATPGQVDGEAVLKEVRSLKKTMVTEWTGESNRGKIGLSGYDVGWVPMGLTAQEMQQIDNEKWNLRRICNIFGVKSQIFNDPDNKAYNNEKEAERALTTRCAMPQLVGFRNNLNRKLQKDWGLKGKGQIVDYDASVYTELQSDTKEMVEWLDKLMARGLPLNRALELLQLERIDEPIFDEPWINQSMGQPLSEWSLNDVESTLTEPEMVDDES